MTAYPYAPAPVVRKPPLPDAMKRASRRAGGIGFLLMSAGWGLFAVAALLGILWASLSALFSALAQRSPRIARGFAEYQRELERLPVGLLVGLLVVVLLVGAAIWVAGLLISHGILRRSGHPHPWGVTWAGLGLGVVASGIVGGIAQFIGQLVGQTVLLPFYGGTESDPDVGQLLGATVVGAVVWLVLATVFHVVAGALLWWAMATAMRPGATAAPGAPAGASLPS